MLITREKIPFNEIDDSVLQQAAKDYIIEHHVIYCQSYLVSQMFEQNVFNFEDYENFYLSDEQIKNYHGAETDEEIQDVRDNGEDIQEVFEHWICSEWLIDKLREQGEPILYNNYGTWWGRTCTGQAIALDYNIQKLAYNQAMNKEFYRELQTA